MNAEEIRESQGQETWYTGTSGGQAWDKVSINIISTCKLYVQFLPNKVNTRPMHLEIPQILFAGCTVNTIGLLPTTCKGNKYALIFMYLLTSYLIAVPLKSKAAEEVTMAYIKHILRTTSCSMFILQDNSTEFINSQLIATFKMLGIQPIYSNPYR